MDSASAEKHADINSQILHTEQHSFLVGSTDENLFIIVDKFALVYQLVPVKVKPMTVKALNKPLLVKVIFIPQYTD